LSTTASTDEKEEESVFVTVELRARAVRNVLREKSSGNLPSMNLQATNGSTAGSAQDLVRKVRSGERTRERNSLYYEIDQFMFHHFFHVPIRHQETDIVTFHGYPPQDYETFGPHHQEPREFVRQNFFQLVGLFNLDR